MRHFQRTVGMDQIRRRKMRRYSRFIGRGWGLRRHSIVGELRAIQREVAQCTGVTPNVMRIGTGNGCFSFRIPDEVRQCRHYFAT